MACGVAAVALPLAVFRFLNSCCATFWGAAEYDEKCLHERVVKIVVGGPFAIDYAREGILVGAFFGNERYDEDCLANYSMLYVVMKP